MSETVHATAIVVGEAGVLIRGASGAGKSMLAAALLARGARLVGDDRVHLSARAGRLLAAPVGPLAGLLELRGRGLLAVPHERAALIRLLVDLVPAEDGERMPGEGELTATLLGVTLARQPVPAGDPGALLLVEAALGESGAFRPARETLAPGTDLAKMTPFATNRIQA